jgi:hypothetical protein
VAKPTPEGEDNSAAYASFVVDVRGTHNEAINNSVFRGVLVFQISGNSAKRQSSCCTWKPYGGNYSVV